MKDDDLDEYEWLAPLAGIVLISIILILIMISLPYNSKGL